MPRHALALALASLAGAPRLSTQDVAPTEPIGTRVARAIARVEPTALRQTVVDLVGFRTRHVRSAAADPAIGTGAARTYLERRLREAGAAAGECLTVTRHAYTVPSQRLRRDVEVVNLVVTLQGTRDPERVYVIGGHYDSINADNQDAQGLAPGANDDASGTAVVVEALRALAGEDLTATVLFVCYDGEEMGLLGSRAHAKELQSQGVRVDGMFTNDIVGNTLGMDGQVCDAYLRCFSYAPRGNDTPGRSLARALTYAVRTHLPEFGVRLVLRGDRYGRGGDHRPFFDAGYPAARISEAAEDFSRQHADVRQRDGRPYGDLPEFVDSAYMAKVCRANVAVLAELACAPMPPGKLKATGARRAYDTLLVLPPVAGAAHYEVVWRLTTSADWEHAKLFPAAASADPVELVLAGVCLDDHVVGVRSVGADGSRSRVTTPPEPDAFNSR